MIGTSIRRKARQFSTLVGRSAMTRRSGVTGRPVLAGRGQLGADLHRTLQLFPANWRQEHPDRSKLRSLDLRSEAAAPSGTAHARSASNRCGAGHPCPFRSLAPSIAANHREPDPPEVRQDARSSSCPKHLRDLVGDLGFSRVVELEWWQQLSTRKRRDRRTLPHGIGERAWCATFTAAMAGTCCAPASTRSITRAIRRISKASRKSGARLSPELALLPIGAYHPASFRNVHASPEDAIQAFLDLGARWMVPMHYGTFRLSYEPVEEPVQRLLAGAKQQGIENKICVSGRRRHSVLRVVTGVICAASA